MGPVRASSFAITVITAGAVFRQRRGFFRVVPVRAPNDFDFTKKIIAVFSVARLTFAFFPHARWFAPLR